MTAFVCLLVMIYCIQLETSDPVYPKITEYTKS